jgi:hypothetical protein
MRHAREEHGARNLPASRRKVLDRAKGALKEQFGKD